MTIYRYDFTIAEQEVNALTYPMDTTGPSHSTTYMSDTNLYFKQGDTIQVRHLHPDTTTSPQLNINYAGPDIHGADPDPTVTTWQDGNPSSTTVSRTREWDSSYSTDDYTRWFFFAPDADGDTVYSSSIIFRKVGYTGFTCGVGTATDGAVTQGEDITFRVATLPGLDTWSSSTPNADRIYLSIRNASTLVLMDPRTYTSGDAWDNSTSELGVFTTADKDTVLTVGSGFPVGTYTVYLTHYNNATRMNNYDTANVGNRFHSTYMQFGSVTMVVSASSGGSGPNPAAFSFTDQGPSGITGGTTYASNTVTLSGMSQASTVTGFTFNETFNGYPAYQIGGAGSWHLDIPSTRTPPESNIAVPANTTIRLKRPASNTAGGTVTMNVTVGTTQSGTWSITTPTADTEPDAFQSQLSSTPYSSQALNATVTSDLVTMAGTSAGSSSSVSVSGESAYWRSRADSSSSFTVYSSSTGTIPAGHQFQFKFNASGVNATETSATIDVGGTTGTIVATTVAGSSGGGAATPNYGLKILNSDGTTLFGNELRTGNVVKYSTDPETVGAASGSTLGSVTISGVEGMTTGNSDEIGVILTPVVHGLLSTYLTVVRGAGSFSVTNSHTDSILFHYTVLRV